MANSTVFTKKLAAASATSIAASASAVAGTPMTLTASPVTIDTATSTNSAIGRRVLLTSTSGSETMQVTLTGTNGSGSVVSETITFSGSSTTLVSNLDYVTVSQVLPVTNSVGNISVGTNATGSSPWFALNYSGTSTFTVSAGVELVTGTGTYSIEYTYDDPNNLVVSTYPYPWTNSTPTALVAATSTKDGLISFPVKAVRFTITAGTGGFQVWFVQYGIG